MNPQAQVTPQVLSWARESAGFTAAEIVEKMQQKKVDSETVANWESGSDKPTYSQLEKLAHIYKRPVALFFLASPPQEDDIAQKFRSLPEQYAKKLSPAIRFMVRKAVIKQLNLEELYADALPKTTIVKVDMAKVNEEAIRLAREFRGRLPVTLAEQKSWRDTDTALKRWRSEIEALGIWIFKDAFKSDNYDGFFLSHDRYPIIYLNNSKARSRQIFTLFHEVGHFLLAKGGICFRQDVEDELPDEFRLEEVFCNAFAGHFLVPDDDLKLDYMPDDDEIAQYVNIYKVSSEVILRKCKDRGLIDWHGYRLVKQRLQERYLNATKPKSPGGNPDATLKTYLGTKYLSLAFAKYYQRQISELQLADYLGVKVSRLIKLEAGLYKGT